MSNDVAGAKKLRLGMLGVSWWTDIVYAGFALAENVDIVWIDARSADKAEAFAAKHGIPNWSSNITDCLNSPLVDAVYIGVPNFLHHQIAMEALTLGKHVFQEKPMALSYGDALQQLELAAANNLILTVNQELRIADGLSDLHAFMKSEIGALKKLVIGVTLAAGEWTGWRGDAALSGGTLFEMIIHELDLARWIFARDPISIYAQGEDVAGKDITVILDFGEGDTAIIDVCWRCIGFGLRVECYGEKGYFRREIALPLGDGRQTLVTESGVQNSTFKADLQGTSTFKRMLERFADAILNGQPPPVSPLDGVWAIRMAEKAKIPLSAGKTYFTG